MKLVRFLIAIVIAGLGWLAGGLGVVSVIADRVSSAKLTPAELTSALQKDAGVAAILCLLLAWAWLLYSDRPTVATDLNSARRTWWIFFLLAGVVWFASFGYFIVSIKDESVQFADTALFLLAGALATWIPYWVSSLTVSAPHVKYVIWPRG